MAWQPIYVQIKKNYESDLDINYFSLKNSVNVRNRMKPMFEKGRRALASLPRQSQRQVSPRNVHQPQKWIFFGKGRCIAL